MDLRRKLLIDLIKKCLDNGGSCTITVEMVYKKLVHIDYNWLRTDDNSTYLITDNALEDIVEHMTW